jgi:hypothetical protein
MRYAWRNWRNADANNRSAALLIAKKTFQHSDSCLQHQAQRKTSQ